MIKFSALFITLFTAFSFSQEISGTWKGILSTKKDFSKEQVVYLDLNGNSPLVRVELVNSDVYALKRIKVDNKSNYRLEIEESSFKSRASGTKTPRCKLKYSVKYNQETGYLEGKFVSLDCRGYSGYVLFYKEDFQLSENKEKNSNQNWVNTLKSNLKKGYAAPEIRKAELANFEFKPIFFDHDKSEVKSKYYNYLEDMVRVVEGHSDIRIKVTGHTDAVGTDEYNIALSQRRAKAIREFFIEKGLPEDKLEIDFKGERQPVATNKTNDGKQRNRRVDFSFI